MDFIVDDDATLLFVNFCRLVIMLYVQTSIPLLLLLQIFSNNLELVSVYSCPGDVSIHHVHKIRPTIPMRGRVPHTFLLEEESDF